MRLIKSVAGFRMYKKLRGIGMETEPPHSVPCFVYEKAYPWVYEENKPVYLYREDLEKMLKKLLDAE